MIEIPYRPEISACDHCGVCCAVPCLLKGYRDVKRLAAHEGVSVDEYKPKLQVEVTPDNQIVVRIKPRLDGGCPYHIDNRCAVQQVKPQGGREFKCWDAETFRLTYYWTDQDQQKLGIRYR